MATAPSVHRGARRAVVARGLLAAGVVAALSVLVPSVAGAVSGPTLYVNGASGVDGGSCRLPARPCATISWALGVATPGSTINVAAGTYPEQLSITKDVTIKGAGATSTVIEPSTLSTSETDTDSDTEQAVIVYVAPGASAALEDLGVNGSAGASSFTGCSDDFVGIYYRDASGSLDNVDITQIEQPTVDFGCQPGPNGGVYVATDSSSTAPTAGNGTPSDWVAPPADWPASNVTMTKVTIDHYDKNGITCDDVGTVCTVTKSTVSGLGPIPNVASLGNPNAPSDNNGQNGIQVWGASASVTHTTVTGDDYTSPQYSPSGENWTYYTACGVLVINADNLTLSDDTIERSNDNIYAMWYPAEGLAPASQGTWSITGNDVSDAVNDTGAVAGSTVVPFGDGFGDGIDLDGPSGVTVSANTALGDAEYGIALLDAAGATVSGNKTDGGQGDGIYVGDDPYVTEADGAASGIAANVGASSGNTVSDNITKGNGVDGILADTTAQDSGNTFRGNTAAQNVRYDIEDLSTGSGTGHTANTWSANICRPRSDSNVNGLC